jgi:hypothetical protein
MVCNLNVGDIVMIIMAVAAAIIMVRIMWND